MFFDSQNIKHMSLCRIPEIKKKQKSEHTSGSAMDATSSYSSSELLEMAGGASM